MKTVHHEGNSNFRVQHFPASRQYLVQSVTHIAGKPYSFAHRMPDFDQDLTEALMEGVEYLRPKIARQEALARGEDPSLPPDPVIDKAIAAKAERDRKHAELLASIKEEQEIAGALLNEANPLWGTF